MTKTLLMSGAALLAFAGAALAQPPAGPGGPRPGRDADVTRQQVIERTDRMFATLDANNDGRFTPEEARQRGEQRRTRHMEQMFDHMDLDRNGSVTREEMRQAHAQHPRGERRAEGGTPGPGGPGGPGMRHRGPGGPGGHGGPGMRHRGPDGAGGPGMRGMRGQRLFGEQGFVTREQFRERALARFDRADADHNGTVTAAERQAARGRMRERMRERRQRPS
jgi:hypothetical protein